MAPPDGARLFDNVVSVSERLPAFRKAPPSRLAILPATVLLEIESVPPTYPAPPTPNFTVLKTSRSAPPVRTRPFKETSAPLFTLRICTLSLSRVSVTSKRVKLGLFSTSVMVRPVRVVVVTSSPARSPLNTMSATPSLLRSPSMVTVVSNSSVSDSRMMLAAPPVKTVGSNVMVFASGSLSASAIASTNEVSPSNWSNPALVFTTKLLRASGVATVPCCSSSAPASTIPPLSTPGRSIARGAPVASVSMSKPRPTSNAGFVSLFLSATL